MTIPLIEIGLIVGVLILAGVMIRLGVLQKRDKYPHHAVNCGCGYHRRR